MSETIKCVCSHCGAKYRLPVEAQGRTARCKRCGERFQIPRAESLEDSVITWLTAPEEDETEEAAPAKPRVISMPVKKTDGDSSSESEAVEKARGPIRLKSGVPKGETA